MRSFSSRSVGYLLPLLAAPFFFDSVHAEPYLAVETGLKCASCHTNPTGGGKRNVFGMTYARTSIAEVQLFQTEETQGWNSEINRWLGVGADYRGGYRSVDVPGFADASDWKTSKAAAYLEIRPIPGLLTLYADEQVAPGGSLNREAWVLLTPAEGKYTIKAGQMFLPFGLRLQDDATFVRQRSGINFDTPDEGVEFGLELPKWSAQVAFSDGTAGAGSQPGKDQTSLSVAHVTSRWRVGTSINLSDDPLGDREMLGVFAGFRTGPISWLAEIDQISDDLPGGGSRDIDATLLEGNWRIRKSQNLKVSYEFLDPDSLSGDDEQERYRVVWEFSPFQLFQARVGYTVYNGVPALPTTNRKEFFLESHIFF
jgi:hypothetical protein